LPLVGAIYAIWHRRLISFVWLVDPFDLRPGGIAPSTADNPYIRCRMETSLVWLAARNGARIWSWSAVPPEMASRAMLVKAFPTAPDRLNLVICRNTSTRIETVSLRLETSTFKARHFRLDWP